MTSTLSIDFHRGLTFIDCEASSLHRGSYPIEVGWATVSVIRGGQPGAGGWADGLAYITTESHLIKPPREWDPDGLNWSWESEQVHKLSRQDLLRFGKEPAIVAARLNAALDGQLIFSDNPGYDGMWLSRLFSIDRQPKFRLSDINSFALALSIGEHLGLDGMDQLWAEQQAVEQAPIKHRAADDARYWATLIALLHERALTPHERRVPPHSPLRPAT